MTSREQFEAWAISDAAECGVDLEFEFDTDAGWYLGEDGKHLNLSWAAWQASRESMVIELPGGSVTPDGQGISLDGFRVIDAMKTAGVKCEVKS